MDKTQSKQPKNVQDISVNPLSTHLEETPNSCNSCMGKNASQNMKIRERQQSLPQCKTQSATDNSQKADDVRQSRTQVRKLYNITNRRKADFLQNISVIQYVSNNFEIFFRLSKCSFV